MKGLFSIAVLVALAAAAPAYAGNPTPSEAEREFVGLLNQERAAHGLAPVEISPALTEIADDYAAFYYAQGVEIDHAYDPPYTERTFAAGCSGWEGPVLARGPSAQFVLDGWLSSSGHRAVLLDPTITHVGPGTQGEYWMSYGMTCERNSLNTSGDFGAIPDGSTGALTIGGPQVRGKLIRAKVTTAASETRVRLIAQRGRKVVRGPQKLVTAGDPTRVKVRVSTAGRWRVWLKADGRTHKLGRVSVR